jgi:hypothetical protein
MGAEMMFDDFRNSRGLPPSSSHHGWDFRPGDARMKWPAGWALMAVAAFSLVVWLLIFFH